MADLDPLHLPAAQAAIAGMPPVCETGMALAIIDTIPSGGSIPAGIPIRKSWGGARNWRDRESWHLTGLHCEGLLAAFATADARGLSFNRHWTVHYQMAGIAEPDAARFIGRLLKLAREYASRKRGHFAAIWVRESGDGKGGHVHILMHVPAERSLKGRTRKWISLAGGTYRPGVSFVRSIGGNLRAAQGQSEHYRHNAAKVCAYVLKGANMEAGNALALPRMGEGGLIIGKRCGWTQNIGKTVRG